MQVAETLAPHSVSRYACGVSGNGKNVKGKIPSPNGDNGRDEKGRFVTGNPGGPGNPLGAEAARFRSQLWEAGTEERRSKLADNLWTWAIEGQSWAVKELFDRLLGKPKESVELTGTFTLAEFYSALGSRLLAS